jgi:integrase
MVNSGDEGMGRILLTDKFIAGVKTAGEYPDAQVRGLRLRVLPSGLKDWSVRYTSPRDGSRQRLQLGLYPATSLASARGRGMEVQALLDAGQDPRLALADAASGAMTVSHLITAYIEKYARPNLRSHRELERRLRRNVESLIGAIKLGELHRRDCARVVDVVLARGRLVEANLVHGDLRAMLRWAQARGDLDHSPMEGMRKPVTDLTPRDRVLDDDEIRTLWHALPTALARSLSVQRILKLCLITGQRVGEVAGMERGELDLKAGTWILPPRRTKNAVKHSVPLSDMALDIIRSALADAPADCPFVFPARTNAGLSAMAVAKTLRRALEPDNDHPHGRLNMQPFVSHDLRRTMLTSLAKLGISPVVAGAVANHVSVTRGTITLKVYTQHSYAAEKAQAMSLWAERLAAIIAAQPAAEILPLQPRKRG